jgi:hypothetical protein
MATTTERWLYKIRNTVRERATCFIECSEPIDFHSLRGEFETRFCKSDCKDATNPFERMATFRYALWQSRKEHKLDTDPLLDELCLVFGDWCAKKCGAKLLFPDEANISFHGEAKLGEYVFSL